MPEALLTIASLVIAATAAGIAFRTDAKMRKLRERQERLQVRFGRAEADLLRTRKRLASDRAAAALARAGRSGTGAIEFSSEFGEDVLIWEALGEPLEGFFIEAGAYDGVTLSVTRGLEAMGWRGLLVEALPERARACASNRPGSRVEHAALGAPGGAASVTLHAVMNEGGSAAGGLELLSHVNTPGAGTEHKRTLERAGARTAAVTVPMTTLDELLSKDPPTVIDAAVIDVEGVEASVLAGFDLRRWRPRLLVVEDNTMGEDDRVASMVRACGYEQAGWVGINRVFVREDERAVVERVRAMSGAMSWPNVAYRFGRRA